MANKRDLCVAIPIRENEETIVFRPVHSTDHGSVVGDADLDGFKDIIRTCEALEPYDAVELDVSPLTELVEGFKNEIARIRFLKGIVCSRRVLGHTGHSPYPEGNAEEGEDGFAEVCQGLCRV